MKKLKELATLEALYNKVNEFDELQEKITTNCLKLNKLEEEKKTYEKMEIPDIIHNVMKSVHFEEQLLLKELVVLEAQAELYDIDNIMDQIRYLEFILA